MSTPLHYIVINLKTSTIYQAPFFDYEIARSAAIRLGEDWIVEKMGYQN